jgi:hypothetical protein
MTTSTTVNEDLVSNNETDFDESKSKHNQKLNFYVNESIKAESIIEELQKKEESQKNPNKSIVSSEDLIEKRTDSGLLTNEEIVEGFSFLSFQSEYDLKVSFYFQF